MKIGINAQVLSGKAIKGTGTYLTNLLDGLSKTDRNNKYIIYYDSRQNPNPPFLKLNSSFNVKGIKIKKGDRFHFWEQLRLPLAVIKDGIDILHCPGNTAPLFINKPMVMTVHDTIAREVPKRFWWDRFYFARLQPKMLRKAVKIITPSDYSKKKISTLMRIPEDKIEVIPNGISASFRILKDKNIVEGALRKLGITKLGPVSTGPNCKAYNEQDWYKTCGMARGKAVGF